MSAVDSEASRRVALATARQGVVLLQNGASGAKLKLPLTQAAYPTVAMIGPNANASMNLLSGYHGSPPFLVSPLEAMRQAWDLVDVLDRLHPFPDDVLPDILCVDRLDRVLRQEAKQRVFVED